MVERGSEVFVESSVDHTPLKTGMIEPARFQAYFQRLRQFVDSQQKRTAPEPSAPDVGCRDPYTITIRTVDANPEVSLGCRDQGGTVFNQLVNDGEFLIYASH